MDNVKIRIIAQKDTEYNAKMGHLVFSFYQTVVNLHTENDLRASVLKICKQSNKIQTPDLMRSMTYCLNWNQQNWKPR